MEEKLLMVMVLLAQGLLVGWKALEKRAERRNGMHHPPPATGGNGSGTKITSLCMDHERRITSNETDIKNLARSSEAMRRENREDHDKIFKKLDALAK